MKHLILFALAVLLLASCRPQYYRPNRVNTPLLTSKGQVQAHAGFNNFQAAYSPAKHLGVLAGYSHYSYHGHEPQHYFRKHVNFFETGAGYYHASKDSNSIKRNQYFLYDIYGGFGSGKIKMESGAAHAQSGVTISRAFIQPGIGVRTRVIEAAFNMRVCGVFYGNYQSHPPMRENFYMFTEPALTFRAGYKAVKLEMQYVRSFANQYSDFRAGKHVLNLGVTVLMNGYRNK